MVLFNTNGNNKIKMTPLIIDYVGEKNTLEDLHTTLEQINKSQVINTS